MTVQELLTARVQDLVAGRASSAEELVDSLSVERFATRGISPVAKAATAFRHLSQAARLAVARTVLAELATPEVPPPSAQSREAAHRAFRTASERGASVNCCPADMTWGLRNTPGKHSMLCDAVAEEIERAGRDALGACGA